MPGSAENFGGFKKKAISWDSDLGEARRLFALRAPSVGWVGWELRFKLQTRKLRFGLGRRKLIFGSCRGQASSLRRGQHVVEFRWKVSIERNCVSLSPRVEKPKGNKNFRTWTNFLFFGFLYVYEPSMNLCLFHVFISWSYFCTWICNI